MKRFYFFITLLTFLIFLFLRIEVRSINPLSDDEREQLRSLSSLDILLFKYLPSISGGSPGNYLLIFPIKQLFPSNKFILGTAGLLTNIVSFLLIPSVIRKFNILEEKNILVSSTIARIFFAFDPKLTYQSMEIRPYSNLPLLWVISVFFAFKLFNSPRMNKEKKYTFKKAILYIIGLVLLFTYHYFSVLMFISIYLFLLIKEKGNLITNIMQQRSLPIIIVSSFLTIPIWFYYTADALIHINHDTLSTLGSTIAEIYAIDKGFPKGIALQNWIYFLFLLLIIMVFLFAIFYFIKDRSNIYTRHKFRLYIILTCSIVLFPIVFIFLTDIIVEYLLGYRQFAWIMLPLYITVSIFLSDIVYSRFVCTKPSAGRRK